MRGGVNQLANDQPSRDGPRACCSIAVSISRSAKETRREITPVVATDRSAKEARREPIPSRRLARVLRRLLFVDRSCPDGYSLPSARGDQSGRGLRPACRAGEA
jgi:hypothetical protein